MHMQSHNNLEDHYDSRIDMSPGRIIQQYKNKAQRYVVSSQADLCRNDGTQLEEEQQHWHSVQVGDTPQEEVLTCEESQYIHNFGNVQKEEGEYALMSIWDMPSFPKMQKKNINMKNFQIQSCCTFGEDILNDIEA